MAEGLFKPVAAAAGQLENGREVNWTCFRDASGAILCLDMPNMEAAAFLAAAANVALKRRAERAGQ